MIEHTLLYMGKFFLVQKFHHVYELWPMEICAWPGQILGRLQFKTMYLYTSKTAPINLFDMISSSKQVFYTFLTGLPAYSKVKKYFGLTKLLYKIKVGQFVSRT